MAVCTMDKFVSAFYQIIKDSRFPICRPYGTPSDDKSYDFGTAFWDGTKYKSNNAATRAMLQNNNFNLRTTTLKTDFEGNSEDGAAGSGNNHQKADEITHNEWNQLLTKIRQEFAIRDEGNNVFIPNVARVGYDERGNAVSGTDNHQFFSEGDEIIEQDYKNIYSDLMALLVYEVENQDAINNKRIPVDRVSYFSDVGDGELVNGERLIDHNNMEEIGNLDLANEGTRIDNNWWDGTRMRQYMYRYATNKDQLYISEEMCTALGRQNAIVPLGMPSDILTHRKYGYTERGERSIAAASAQVTTNKRVVSHKKPYGNKDYIATVTDKEIAEGKFPAEKKGWAKKDKDYPQYYQVSDLYNKVREYREQFLKQNIVVRCFRTSSTGETDEYGNLIYTTKYKDIPMPLVYALASKVAPVSGGWTIDIAASNINKYFMKLINLISSLCVCNCNYCSCFGHEASCICYVVKVSGFCYSYQYEVVNGNFNNCVSPETLEKEAEENAKKQNNQKTS